jgi:xanthine dehydrogenase YagT iron-sulfur-binding subunit
MIVLPIRYVHEHGEKWQIKSDRRNHETVVGDAELLHGPIAIATGEGGSMNDELNDEAVESIALSPSSKVSINLKINGANYQLQIEPRVSLLDALREYLGLTGTKKGCDQGACGACTVLADGERIISCLALAVQYERREITTIEGLAENGELHPLQAAFIEHDGFQCGYCTPGQVCSAVGMFNEFQNGLPSAVTKDISTTIIEFSDEEIKERMSGNLCRCGAYIGICEAIRDAFETEVR